jgi:3-carboxy-cis,cis-muconate cycloisomerase
MTSFLRDRPAATADMLAVFCDAATLRAALAFEAALAGGLAEAGVVQPGAAVEITEVCAAFNAGPAELAEAAAHAGTLAIPLVGRLREACSGLEVARCVHLGATSQDLADTVLMLQAKQGIALMVEDLGRLADGCAMLARTHAGLPMLGRTLLQQAAPISFGLKAAQWMLGVDAARARLGVEARQGIALQFGGAVGTRAGLEGQASSVARFMAERLGLACPPLPWHARRDGVAGIATALAIAVGAVGKIASDVALLAQGEVGEAREPLVAGRGGSSAMAHKRNPTGCQVAVSAALRAPGLAATILAGMPQQHERGLGGWQAEAPVLADLFCIAHGALRAMLPVVEALEIDAGQMQANLAGAHLGLDMGESESMVAAALAARANCA